MSQPANADLQRWSADVARNPGSPAFLPLARAYRRRGQREAAVRLCLRALERQPTHVEGHALLALLYLEGGEHEKATDEWATVLRLDPENFEAHRGLGFSYLERGNAAAARRHLERAVAHRPDDSAVRDALALLIERYGANGTRPTRDPERVFEALLVEPALLGTVLVDARGLVLAGSLRDGGVERAEILGALVGSVLDEAARTVGHLSLGPLGGALIETETAVLYLSPLELDAMLLVAATRGVPTGWILRTAARATELARAYLGG